MGIGLQKDRGPGIPKVDLPYIFEPFYRVDKSRSRPERGFGLGLSLCKSIMEGHNGKIEIDSVPGETITVCLYFPLKEDKAHT
jgi:signal transduction histidine kinase